MSFAALELNDVGLVLRWEGGGSEPSPGCALFEDGTLVTGQAASSRSRLLPRHVHDRFWAELGTEPLPPPFPAELSTADLAHEQLQGALRESGRDLQSLILAVPGSYTGQQLGLLLGIARALPVRVCGLIDAALAAGHAATTTEHGVHVDVELHRSVVTEHGVHVDVELHRSVVTELRVEGNLTRGRVRVTDGAGLATLRTSLVRRIASLFVEGTRFDPLSSAAAEQQLFALIPTLSAELAEGAAGQVELETSQGSIAVEVESSVLVAESRATVEALLNAVRPLVHGRTRVLVSSRAASIPGLLPALTEIAQEQPEVLAPGAGAEGALQARSHVETEGEALPYVVSLPLRDSGDDGDGQAP